MHLLNSWKEIATYLGRGVRTVQRWEKIGLPVRRLGKGRRAPVISDRRELDLWVMRTAQGNGFRNPQSAAPLVFRGQLDATVRQSHRLHDEMTALRQANWASVLRLTESLAAMEKACASSDLENSEPVASRTQPGRRRLLDKAEPSSKRRSNGGRKRS